MTRGISPEPDSDNGLLFMPPEGAPVKDPAVRKRLKKQVMQHVGKYRRKAGLNRRQHVIQYSLEVDNDFLLGSGAVATQTHAVPLLPKMDNGDRLLPNPSPERLCSPENGRPSDCESLSFDRLGIGPLDPFAKYPFQLDDRAKELIYTVCQANSGSVCAFKVVAFKMIWMEVTIIDAAAFHQYIAGAQAYFDFLHKAKSGGHFSPQVVAHRARALRIINSKVAKPETAGSDGVIASVVLFARYYQMIGDLGNWKMHMLGLKQIIHLRGDIDSIGINELLRHMLSNIDISGSFALDADPIFPMPTQLLPSAPLGTHFTTLEPLPRYFITTWRSRLLEHTNLIDIITDIVIENVHFRREITRSKGTLWTETMYLCHYINLLLHRLLSLPRTDSSLPCSLVAEALRLGAIIHLGAIRYAFGISPFQTEVYVRQIKELLGKLDGLEDYLQHLGWRWIKIWTLGCAVIGRPLGQDGQWFLEMLHAEMDKLGIQTYDEFEKYVGSFLWTPEVHGVLLRGLPS